MLTGRRRRDACSPVSKSDSVYTSYEVSAASALTAIICTTLFVQPDEVLVRKTSHVLMYSLFSAKLLFCLSLDRVSVLSCRGVAGNGFHTKESANV